MVDEELVLELKAIYHFIFIKCSIIILKHFLQLAHFINKQIKNNQSLIINLSLMIHKWVYLQISFKLSKNIFQ